MARRLPCASSFYAGASERLVSGYREGFQCPSLKAPPKGGVVPHAGWTFSGRTAARVFFTIKDSGKEPETFVFLGAVHRYPVDQPTVDTSETWSTPFGDISVDKDLIQELLEKEIGLVGNPAAHRDEHSIEVAAPFIRLLFPRSSLVPIVCPPAEGAHAFGIKLGQALRGRNVIVMASTDLTHYGFDYGFAPAGSKASEVLDFMKKNDGRIIQLALSMRAEEIVPEARANMNACGSGALAACVAASKALGAESGVLVEYSTSYEAMPEDPLYRCVGYAGLVFV